ncbi:MAG TPA: methyltransferase domain-containing protein [Streptosporangiales bacterium]
MTPKERWFASTLPFVRAHIPPAPARVVEIGCGTLGGLVPDLLALAYDVVGVDPEAPDGPAYRQVEVERYEPPARVDAIVAATSLHHVADLREVVDWMASALVPGGRLVVVEWARERFDEATAQWCFARLPERDEEEQGWLHGHRDRWRESDQPWQRYCDAWAEEERLHTGGDIFAALDTRFEPSLVLDAPYFFPELDGVTEADEQEAIDAGRIRANGIRYAGRLRPTA